MIDTLSRVVRCRICQHPKRAALEADCARGTSIPHVATQFEVSVVALERHIASHVQPAPLTSMKGAAISKQLLAAKARVYRRPQAAKVEAVPAALPPSDDESPATSRSPEPSVTARANAHRIARSIDELLVKAQADKGATYQEVVALARAALAANRQLAHLTGEWGASESTVASSPHFKRLLNVILESLQGERFAGARTAVIDALEREESGGRAVAA